MEKRRLSWNTIYVLLYLGVLLAACGGVEGETTPVPGLSTDTFILMDTPGAMATVTPPFTPMPVGTATPVEETEQISQNTPGATAQATAGLPGSGMNDPARISNLLDYQIWNLDRNQIGEVDDMVIDLTTRHVDYVLIQVGGLLSIGGRLIPVPWNALILQADQAGVFQDPAFYINVREETLQNAPVVEVDTLSDVNNPDWDAEFRGYWQNELGEVSGTETVTPTLQADPGGLQGTFLAENLLEFGVRGTEGEALGEVADLIVDTQTGEALYVLVATGGVLGAGQRLIPVPLDVMSIDSAEGVLTLPIDGQTLGDAPGFDPGGFPNASTAGWDTDIRQYWEEARFP